MQIKVNLAVNDLWSTGDLAEKALPYKESFHV